MSEQGVKARFIAWRATYQNPERAAFAAYGLAVKHWQEIEEKDAEIAALKARAESADQALVIAEHFLSGLSVGRDPEQIWNEAYRPLKAIRAHLAAQKEDRD